MFGALTIIAMAAAGASNTPAKEQMEQWHFRAPLAAYVQNSSGEVFALDCNEAACKYFLALNGDCKEGMQIGAIINGEGVETATTLTCHVVGKGNILIIGDSNLGRLMSGEIAFAFPQTDSLIAVSRFSLAGASAAIAPVIANYAAGRAATDAAAPTP